MNEQHASEGVEETSFTETLYPTPTQSDPYLNPYFHAHGSTRQESESFFNFGELGNDEYDRLQTNDPESRTIPNPGAPTEPSILHQTWESDPVANFADHAVGLARRSLDSYVSAQGAQNAAHYNISTTTSSQGFAQTPTAMSMIPHTEKGLLEQSAEESQYGAYRGLFATAAQASTFRKEATRFNRQPYIPPNEDTSISTIEQNRTHHVERIYNAMTRGDVARDNSGSIAMKRWVHHSYYDPGLVEAYAHKVFDCLLLQSKEGFRGWNHNDYVVDDRKGEDEDRDVDCAARLDNVIRALEEEKTICEDVMNSACQIRIFVNAPKAYATRKYQNRIGNSKRGRGKDTPEVGDKSSKSRKLNPRPPVRARRANSSSSATFYPPNQPLSKGPELSPQQRTQLQFAGSPHMRMPPRVTPVTDHFESARMTQPSFVNQVHAMSRSTAHAPNIQRTTNMPQRHLPFKSPPPRVVSSHSTPVIAKEISHSDDAQTLFPLPLSLFEDMPDPTLFDQGWDLPYNDHMLNTSNANLFEHHPSAAFLEHQQSLNGESIIEQLWEHTLGANHEAAPQSPGIGHNHHFS